VRCAATPVRSQWVLDGAKDYVVDGGSAGLILVVAQAGDGPAAIARATAVSRALLLGSASELTDLIGRQLEAIIDA
jgi:alkylation response protein AidB-like acyl-CoA dehydrogenase